MKQGDGVPTIVPCGKRLCPAILLSELPWPCGARMPSTLQASELTGTAGREKEHALRGDMMDVSVWTATLRFRRASTGHASFPPLSTWTLWWPVASELSSLTLRTRAHALASPDSCADGLGDAS